MGKLTELEQWDEDIYQIETSDPVLGGPEGVSNRPQKQLANRTQWLKKRLEDANNALAEHEKSRNHPDATLTDRGFVKLYSGVTSMDETLAATPKAVKIAMDNANERLAKARNLADLQSIPLALANLTLTSVKVAVENAYLGAVSLPAQSVATDEAFTSIGSGYIRLWKNQTPGSPLPTDNWCYINIVGKRDANTGGVCVRAVEWNNPGNSWTGIRLNSNPGTAFTWAKDFNTLNKPSPEDVGLAATKKAVDDTQIGLAVQGVMWLNTADDLSNLPSGARRFASNKAPATVLPAAGYFFLEVLAKRDTANGSCILATSDTRDVWIGFRYTVPDEAGFTWIQLNQNVENLGLTDTVNRASHVNATDGDLYGTQWGGWLSSYIRRNTPSVPSLTPYATTTWVNQNFLSGFRLGGVEGAQVWRAFGYDDNPPYVITGVINGNTDDLIDFVKRRPLQMYINGWRNIDWT